MAAVAAVAAACCCSFCSSSFWLLLRRRSSGLYVLLLLLLLLLLGVQQAGRQVHAGQEVEIGQGQEGFLRQVLRLVLYASRRSGRR